MSNPVGWQAEEEEAEAQVWALQARGSALAAASRERKLVQRDAAQRLSQPTVKEFSVSKTSPTHVCALGQVWLFGPWPQSPS